MTWAGNPARRCREKTCSFARRRACVPPETVAKPLISVKGSSGAGSLVFPGGSAVWNSVKTEGRWIRCVPPYSFYHDLIGRYWAGGPSEEAGAPIHRVCTLARKMGARSLVVEDVLDRVDVAEEIAHLVEWAQTEEGIVSACAITFLSSGTRRDHEFSAVRTSSIIGQVTLVTFPSAQGPRTYVYEAIFRLPGKGASNEQLLNNHVPVARELTVATRDVEHRLQAAYFCQQNGVTSICAHSAVRTLVRTLTSKPISVPMLNGMWNYDPAARTVLTTQVETALRHFGLRPVAYDLQHRQDPQPDSGWDLLALLADSASPSLLVLSGKAVDHIVPVLGHTVNSRVAPGRHNPPQERRGDRIVEQPVD